MAITKEVTFEGLKYNLDNQDRLAAEVAHQSAGNLVPVENLVGADGSKSLTMADSGKLFTVDTANGTQDIVLPEVTNSAGFHCKFVFTVLSDEDLTITESGTTDVIIFSGTDFTASGNAQVHTTDTCTTLKANADTANATVGTSLEVWCNGTNYFIKGHSDNQHNSNRAFTVSG
jgi:hypothetical protein